MAGHQGFVAGTECVGKFNFLGSAAHVSYSMPPNTLHCAYIYKYKQCFGHGVSVAHGQFEPNWVCFNQKNPRLLFVDTKYFV